MYKTCVLVLTVLNQKKENRREVFVRYKKYLRAIKKQMKFSPYGVLDKVVPWDSPGHSGAISARYDVAIMVRMATSFLVMCLLVTDK